MSIGEFGGWAFIATAVVVVVWLIYMLGTRNQD